MGMKIGFADMIAQAEAAIETVPVADAIALHAAGEALLVDIRDVRELWREGAVPGAEHAPRGMLEFWFHPDSPYFKPVFGKDRQYLLFCAAGWRSALAAKTLQDMGVARVAHIEGGFKAWKEAGGAVEEKSKG